MSCPFCEPDSHRVFYDSDPQVYCLWDGYPVSDGHALVITRRHIESWFGASRGEQSALLEGIEAARQEIERLYQPDGFNIGVNVGDAAGQTIPHLHVHVIPRYSGDVANPRGGVRHVIPEKGDYEVRDSGTTLGPNLSASVYGGESFPLLGALAQDLAGATSIDLAVAFVTESGLAQLQPHLLDLLDRDGRMRLLTGDYLDVTEPNALRVVADWVNEYSPRVSVRIFQADSELGFHPKAYLLEQGFNDSVAFVGSSNLTKTALVRGLEWNQRMTGNSHCPEMKAIRDEFERLFSHPKTVELSEEWIRAYQARRTSRHPTVPSVVGIDPEADKAAEVPVPHPIQAEALDALVKTRNCGNEAGLVVMATGLGKTWLAAFDSAGFKRVLFVAHREEILKQALATFRKIRPDATLGLYLGGQHDRDADVLFASIQTLSRQNHLNAFDAARFDYIVVDEFHHAAARTYRRLIDHFEPDFLLGLTATPERSDGGDLLGLCGENLVFRCDLMEGIKRSLLCPFQYFGVPDEVDFENIPWRSSRFDPEKLEHAVATEARAQSAFHQWEKRGQTRTIGFCVSKRHANFMADFFSERGCRAVAVHSGTNSAPRALSLERLENGELDVVFAVDMFNEGVDVPAIDTVIMLRPTESKILWLQQFGRGLRKSGDKRLSVIDYIGNHRTFLQVPMLLLPGAGSRPGEVSMALKALERGELELPEGCSVEYDLEALNILRQLSAPTAGVEQIIAWYDYFEEIHGRRPMASEAFHEGYDPKKVRNAFGSWVGFVSRQNGLSGNAAATFDENREYFEALEVTPMTRSFKMITLLAMIAESRFPGTISIDSLVHQATKIASRIDLLRKEFGAALDSPEKMKRLLEENPINAWTGSQGMGGTAYFHYENGQFSSFEVGLPEEEELRELTREICDWRLAQYLDRLHGESRFARSIVCKVSHSGGTPILFLPERDKNPGIPEGWTAFEYEGARYEAKFVKVAINVISDRPEGENKLPELTRHIFGEDAGQPGTHHQVRFEFADGIYRLQKIGAESSGPVLWREYDRAEIPPLWGLPFSTGNWNQGFVTSKDHLFLLVSLEKAGLADEHQYGDRFLSADTIQWVSQNRTKRDSNAGRRLSNHKSDGTAVHLFVRDRRKTPKGTGAPFFYCGEVEFLDWSGDQPITIQWKLGLPLPEALMSRFGV